MFWYFPIEPYEERYTVYLSSPGGFWETFLDTNKIARISLRPDIGGTRIREGKGQVLDTTRRCIWAQRQVELFLTALDAGGVGDNDVLFIEDFWHPGFESLMYAKGMYKKNFKIYTWCHADTWDTTDFTHLAGLTWWMQPFELAIANACDGIFVADAGLKELMVAAGVDGKKVHPVGTCWNTEWMREKYGYFPGHRRENTVVFASRWDKEKNPDFYMKLALDVIHERSDVQFYVTTGFEKLRSSDAMLVKKAYKLRDYSSQFEIKENVSKPDYMKLLNSMKVHFNCASHDWVSYALLESCAMGVMPLFPNYRSFPLALQFDLDHLYEPLDLESAKRKLYTLLDTPQRNMDHILARFDRSISYVAHTMGIY